MTARPVWLRRSFRFPHAHSVNSVFSDIRDDIIFTMNFASTGSCAHQPRATSLLVFMVKRCLKEAVTYTHFKPRVFSVAPQFSLGRDRNVFIYLNNHGMCLPIACKRRAMTARHVWFRRSWRAARIRHGRRRCLPRPYKLRAGRCWSGSFPDRHSQ